MPVSKLDHKTTCSNWAASQNKEFGTDRGPEMAVGGHFQAFGIVEREMLRFYGLTDQSSISLTWAVGQAAFLRRWLDRIVDGTSGQMSYLHSLQTPG